MTDIKNLVNDVVASPLGEVIASVGEGVAAAQQALDEASLATVLEIYREGGDEKIALLREIGYRPTFYALPDTQGEVRVSLKLGQPAGIGQSLVKKAPRAISGISTNLSRAGLNFAAKRKIYATPVDAGYANRYGYSADISAKLTFKIVAIPPPDGTDEMRFMPDLVDRKIKDARDILSELGLGLRVITLATDTLVDAPNEDSVIQEQDIEAFSIVRLDDVITVKVP